MNRALVVTAVLLLAFACRRPFTDIVATTTEDVGNYRLSSTVVDNALVGRVCIEDPAHAEEIARRLVEQLKNQNYRQMTFDLYAADRAIREYVWTPRGLEPRATVSGASNPCTGSAGN